MFWTEETEEVTQYQVPDDIVDLSYRIGCRALPNDHAWSLSQAVQQHLPWLVDDLRMGIHLIHGPESMNGWMRPEDPDALIHLSRRSRLTLRLQGDRVGDALQLEGETLEFDDYRIELGKAMVRSLSTYEVQFSRHVIGDPDADEETFLQQVASELKEMDIAPRKLMCGMNQTLRTPAGDVSTRSLLVADLEPVEAVALQENGIGEGRLLGCGLFVPHKGIKSAKQS